MHLKNFKLYKTEDMEYQNKMYRIQYVKSECGKDWYDERNKLTPSGYYVMYNHETKHVIQCETDPTMLGVGEGHSVINVNKVPEGNILQEKRFIVHCELVVENPVVEDYVIQNNKEVKHNLMNIATGYIDTLRDKIDLDMSNDKELLQKYILYRIKVSEVDINCWSPAWPECPF